MPIVSSVVQAIRDNSSPSRLSLVFVAGTLVYVSYKTGSIVFRVLTSPLRSLPGPPSPHFFWGAGKAVAEADKTEIGLLQEQWVEQYGPTIAYQGVFGASPHHILNSSAINHILTNDYIYQKPRMSRIHLSRIVGQGVLVAEEDQHRNQRRVLNPAFGPAQVRELTEIFVEKSQLLRDRWLDEIEKSSADNAHVDAMSWLSKATLDIIGLAGFNYNFDALSPDVETNELNEAFNTIFTTQGRLNLFVVLQAMLPILRIFKSKGERKSAEAQKTMRRIGLQLIAEKKASILAASGQSNVERKDVLGRDLLTLLIKANMATDIPESQRLTDEEVLSQVPTFIVAGHETTSTATTWALFALTQHPKVQRKLRDELYTIPTENPTMDELQALPYLDMVVKEVLRYYSPVPLSARSAMKDDVIPCSTPYTDKDGVQRDHVRVKKHDVVAIPILALSRYKPYWGEDAKEFKPERWEHLPDAVASIPGVFGNTLSFLGGPRSCIGYRFSLVEMKALLFTLIRSFEFELGVPADKVKKRTAIVQRPIVVGDDDKEEGKMPLFIRPYVHT
ncbi:cytochrome P450 [Cytidiella melzeri]|nr:cytochrome P450 [Cytidiella melzeri]